MKRSTSGRAVLALGHGAAPVNPPAVVLPVLGTCTPSGW